MSTWADGGSSPPRAGFYAESAQLWLTRAANNPQSVQRLGQAGIAQAYATLELAAATERALREAS